MTASARPRVLLTRRVPEVVVDELARRFELELHDAETPLPRDELFTRAAGRFVMWHVKDMHKVSRDYTELGNGTIDYTKIWPDAAMSGMTHFFVEQGGNFAVNAMQSAADGMAYVKKYLMP